MSMLWGTQRAQQYKKQRDSVLEGAEHHREANVGVGDLFKGTGTFSPVATMLNRALKTTPMAQPLQDFMLQKKELGQPLEQKFSFDIQRAIARESDIMGKRKKQYSTLLTSPLGVEEEATVQRKSLLGA